MNFNMQQLEDMNELDRLYLFEDIPEEDHDQQDPRPLL